MNEKWDQYKYYKKEHCRYPFEPCPVGYCWGYANYIDEGETDEEIESHLCKGCEFHTRGKARKGGIDGKRLD